MADLTRRAGTTPIPPLEPPVLPDWEDYWHAIDFDPGGGGGDGPPNYGGGDEGGPGGPGAGPVGGVGGYSSGGSAKQHNYGKKSGNPQLLPPPPPSHKPPPPWWWNVNTARMPADATRVAMPPFEDWSDEINTLSNRDRGTITPVPLPDWFGESEATIELIGELDNTLTKILDAITFILNFFDGQPADPPYNIKATGSPQYIQALAIVVENKITVLLAFFTKFKSPPPGPSQALDNYNALWQRLVNLENWYMINLGSHYAPNPYTYPP